MLLLKFLAGLPAFLLEPLAIALFWLTYPFAGRDRQLVEENVWRVYRLPSHSSFSRMFVRQVLRSQVLCTLEMLKYTFHRNRVHIEGFEELKQKIAQAELLGAGHIVITPHLGSWELAGHFGALAAAKPLNVLAKPSKSPYLTKVLDKLRTMLKMHVLWTDAKTLFRDMLSAIDRGESIGFVMDQRPGKKGKGHNLPFMGVPDVPMVGGTAMVACKKNVPVYGIYCVREGLCRYRVISTEVLPPNHGITDEAEATRLMTEDMEKQIRLYPEQWAWNYNRFKGIPI